MTTIGEMHMEQENEVSPPRALQLKDEDKSLAPVDTNNIWQDDALNREREAKVLESLIASQDGPLTLCLDGAWGTGKTFFLRRFKLQWETNGGKALYFNAWEDDNLDDPLIALIGQLWPLLKPSGMDGIVDNIKKCTIPLIKKIALNRVGVDGKDVASSASNAFDEYAELQTSRQQLKECLSKVADHFFDTPVHRPLLFIIDELDRCRPSFAIAVLERIKHLFPIKHLVFLIGVDKEQVKASVRSVYGNIDSENYLHRFFDATLKLTQYSSTQFVYAAYGYVHDPNIPATIDYIRRTRFEVAQKFCPLIQHFKMSLREVEVAMRTYTLLIPVNSECGDTMMCCLMIALSMKDKIAYRHLVSWDLPIGRLIDTVFGDLRKYDRFDADTSPISFIRYLYRLEMLYDDNTQQQQDLLNLIQCLENGSEYDINSPLIAEFLRENKTIRIHDILFPIKRGAYATHYSFRDALHAVDEKLEHIGDVRLN